jgi:acyl-coenzyme A synthetase/AMP-(fatty) acid ligase
MQGMQVAPAELEAHILTHPWVSDCAVIEVPHEMSGEVPKAFIVRSPASKGQSEQQVAEAVSQFVKEHKAHYKWLVGGVEFIAAIPKNPTGKILRRLLRDREREARKMNGPTPARL